MEEEQGGGGGGGGGEHQPFPDSLENGFDLTQCARKTGIL